MKELRLKIILVPTLQIAFSAHGCLVHASLHFWFEHCSLLAQSASFEQHFFSSRPSQIVVKHKILIKTIAILIWTLIFCLFYFYNCHTKTAGWNATELLSNPNWNCECTHFASNKYYYLNAKKHKTQQYRIFSTQFINKSLFRRVATICYVSCN